MGGIRTALAFSLGKLIERSDISSDATASISSGAIATVGDISHGVWTWKNIFNLILEDVVSGICIICIIGVSFLVVISFADFLRLNWGAEPGAAVRRRRRMRRPRGVRRAAIPVRAIPAAVNGAGAGGDAPINGRFAMPPLHALAADADNAAVDIVVNDNEINNNDAIRNDVPHNAAFEAHIDRDMEDAIHNDDNENDNNWEDIDDNDDEK